MVAGRFRAIISMIVAVAAFSGMDALLKILAADYPPFEVAVLRGTASLPFMLAPIALANRWRLLKPRRFPMHLLRGALQVLVLGGFIYAVRSLSLANTYAVFLSAPLMMTALAVPILKERTDARGWLAIIAGLIGVLIMLRPSVSGFSSLGSLAALGAAFGYAMNGIAVRVLTRTDTTASVVVWTISLMSLMALMLALPGWVPLEPRHYRWLLLLGALAAVGSYCLTEAFRSAPAAVVAPLEYTSLLWGVIIDRVVWGVLPSARVLCGGAVVIASGLYLVWGERTRSLRGGGRGTGARSEAEWQPSPPLQHARQQEEDAS
ncbi:MAG TPA: DMT family transporter [Steroidobacteraceae bacterium]|nr:DMT family transporter [Steroidobacteraceae bacterium]